MVGTAVSTSAVASVLRATGRSSFVVERCGQFDRNVLWSVVLLWGTGCIVFVGEYDRGVLRLVVLLWNRSS